MLRSLGRTRWALWAGVGAGLAVLFYARRANGRRQPPANGALAQGHPQDREWHADFRPGPDGRLDPNALADEASADSFPASDPPATMVSVIPGAPMR